MNIVISYENMKHLFFSIVASSNHCYHHHHGIESQPYISAWGSSSQWLVVRMAGSQWLRICGLCDVFTALACGRDSALAAWDFPHGKSPRNFADFMGKPSRNWCFSWKIIHRNWCFSWKSSIEIDVLIGNHGRSSRKTDDDFPLLC